MAQNVLDASTTNTQLDDNNLNPDRTAPRTIVHCTLVFDGVTFVPDNLYDALDAQYGTVGYEKNVASQKTYIFNIAA